MTWSDRRYDDGLQPRPRMSEVVKWIIIATVAVWLVQAIGGQEVQQWQVRKLGLHPPFSGGFFVWQPVTYLFVHSAPPAILHLAFNMLCLVWFGRAVEGAIGSRRFAVLYVCGGLVAGLSYCMFCSFRSLAPVIGASGSVMAVLVGFAVLFPESTLLFMLVFPMKAKHMVMLLVAADLLLGVKGSSSGIAHSAHLGGAFFGFLFFKFAPFVRSASSGHAAKKLKKQLDGVQKERAQVDKILDKINREGMGSLTKAERRFLMEASKHYRERSDLD